MWRRTARALWWATHRSWRLLTSCTAAAQGAPPRTRCSSARSSPTWATARAAPAWQVGSGQDPGGSVHLLLVPVPVLVHVLADRVCRALLMLHACAGTCCSCLLASPDLYPVICAAADTVCSRLCKAS